jgi:glycosyltransferase involved in cell wall biosynthesis
MHSTPPPANTIAVIIVTYNHENWIDYCINSVLSQRKINTEIFIHDDNSTDKTLEILQKYKDRCTIVSNETGRNHGVSESYNVLHKLIINKSRSKYVALISGDDAWHEDKLFSQFEALEADKTYDICFTDSLTLNERNEIGPKYPAFLELNLTWHQWIYRLIMGNCLPMMSAMLRRSIWFDSNRLDGSLHQLQDWDYWIRALLDGLKFHTIQAPLTFYRVHENSVSHHRGDALNSRACFETSKIVKNYLRLSPGELRHCFGNVLEMDEFYRRDRSTVLALAIILSKINSPGHRLAAAELLHKYYSRPNNAISNSEYHEFMGRLNIGR